MVLRRSPEEAAKHPSVVAVQFVLSDGFLHAADPDSADDGNDDEDKDVEDDAVMKAVGYICCCCCCFC